MSEKIDHEEAVRVARRALNRKQTGSAQTFRRGELKLARAYLDLASKAQDTVLRVTRPGCGCSICAMSVDALRACLPTPTASEAKRTR